MVRWGHYLILDNNWPISPAVIGYCLCERGSERNTRMGISVSCVTFIEGYNFVTCTFVFLSLCYHCWENFTISQIICKVQSVKPLTKTKRGRLQRCSYYRGSKSMKVGIFFIFETKRTTHKKSRVVHIREFFIRRVLTVSLLFISLSRSKWREEDQHCTRFMASGSWYQQNILSHVPEDAISPKGV